MTKTIKREDLSKAIVTKTGLGAVESKAMVDDIFDLIGAALHMNGQVKLRGFGNFTKHSKAERLGRNPKTGETAVVSARNSVSFHASKMLIAKMNTDD